MYSVIVYRMNKQNNYKYNTVHIMRNSCVQENETCSMDSFNSSNCPGASCQFYDYVVDPNIPRLHVSYFSVRNTSCNAN